MRATTNITRLRHKKMRRTKNSYLLRSLLGLALAAPRPDERWVLVTSAFHMRRAVASFCAAGWKNIVPWPTDYRTGGFADRIGWNFAQNLNELNLGVREWTGLAAYSLTSRTSDAIEISDCLAVQN